MVHYISPAPLTFEVIDKILSKNYKLALSEDSKKLINDCKAYLDHKIESSAKPLYGITTGFGSLCKISISKEDLSQLQANLVMSHACSLGEPIHQDIIRLMLLLKAHALSLGKSGVQLVTVERIIDMFNHNVLPVVRELGSLGASGDLAPLANLFLPLINEGEVWYKGKICDAKAINAKLGWAPIELGAKEGLALLNGTQFMSSHAVYALLKAFKIAKYRSAFIRSLRRSNRSFLTSDPGRTSSPGSNRNSTQYPYFTGRVRIPAKRKNTCSGSLLFPLYATSSRSQ